MIGVVMTIRTIAIVFLLFNYTMIIVCYYYIVVYLVVFCFWLLCDITCYVTLCYYDYYDDYDDDDDD